MWWATGMTALNLMTAAFFPTIEGDTSFDAVIANLPAPMRSMIGMQEGLSISTAPGYLNGRLFSLLLPVLLVVFAIGTGTRGIAGSEGDGTLELLLANPVSRTRVLAERLAATTILVVGLTVVSAATLLVIGAPFGLLHGVSIASLVAGYLAAGCLALLFGSLSFAVGACTGHKSTASGVAAAGAVGTYLLQALLANSTGLSWMRSLSPWQWYGSQPIIVQGAPATAFIPALFVSAVLGVIGWRTFIARDLR